MLLLSFWLFYSSKSEPRSLAAHFAGKLALDACEMTLLLRRRT